MEAVTHVFSVLETLEQQAFKECSKGKPFFGGDTAGFVDVVLGGHRGHLRGEHRIDAAKTPLLVAWAEWFCALDAVKGLILDMESWTGSWSITRPDRPALPCRCSCRTWSCSSNNAACC